MKIKNGLFFLSLVFILSVFNSCKDEVSSTTGWKYNNEENGGFQYYSDYLEQETGPDRKSVV